MPSHVKHKLVHSPSSALVKQCCINSSGSTQHELSSSPSHLIRVVLCSYEIQGIGAAQDAVRMQRVVNFYEKLPRGPAPEPTVNGPLTWYQKKYFGKNPSAARESAQGRHISSGALH